MTDKRRYGGSIFQVAHGGSYVLMPTPNIAHADFEIVYVMPPPSRDQGRSWVQFLRNQGLLAPGIDPILDPDEPKTYAWVNYLVAWTLVGYEDLKQTKPVADPHRVKLVKRALRTMKRDAALRARVDAVWRLGGKIEDIAAMVTTYDWNEALPRHGGQDPRPPV